ncbi:MAG: tRNA adenosine(34) deaminase TadA [Candidatus Palauibacterales bacterium]|nr:tRNA adenosine(34) deaminase TadA [Candidatus Palauibacterales bacterium]MDP2482347.1 tRNA adenosine(34) deaminase TadA [Candidatus Palauibacterales bacterium]
MIESDLHWMERAVELAREAAAHEEVPVGAVVVAPDGTAFEERNRTRELADPTAHAEMLAIRRAAAHQGDWRLEAHTLFVTLEPCAMCAGAIVLSRVDRVVFAAHDPKAGMCGSLGNLVQDGRLNHSVQLVAGVRAEEASALLRSFFAERR